ncbi:MAG TPA: hypothetical protein VG365_11500 [Solirubrobacteraceae bacterium]|nr:hypothetical protein [Solirubrobacteraceae bacterium]
MSWIHASGRVALAVSLLALLLLSAGATTAGYLVEAHNQRVDRAQRLADAAAFVEHGATQAETTRWQQSLTRKLTALRLNAGLAMLSLTSKRVIYVSRELVPSRRQVRGNRRPEASPASDRVRVLPARNQRPSTPPRPT